MTLDALNNRLVNDPRGFSTEHGNFHDCRITCFEVKPSRKLLLIAVDDLFSNFLGLPEYRGPLPAEFIFGGLIDLDISIDMKNGELNIYDMEFNQREDGSTYIVTIKLSPGGSVKVICESLAIDKNRDR